MNAKNFAGFAMGLLRKKVAATGGSLRTNTKGSHPKIHVKKQKGPSGGITFRIHHGGDDHGFAPQQKATLDKIFRI